MAKVLQHRRDTTTNLASVSGAIGEFFMDTTKNTLVVMDGSTNGGHPLALESDLVSNLGDLSNVTLTTPSTGQVLKYNGSIWVNSSDAGGIALTDLSVTTNSAGSAALSYDNTTGAFSYTPPDLSSYQTTSGLDSAIDSHLNYDPTTTGDGYLLSYDASTAAYAWVAPYGNSDVDSHLNQNNPSSGYVLSWNGSDYQWVAQASGADGNTQYTVQADTTTGGANITLVGNDASTDSVKLAAGANIAIQRSDASTITIGSTVNFSTVGEDILPLFDEVYDLGSTTKQFYDAFLSNSLVVGNSSMTTNSVVIGGATVTGSSTGLVTDTVLIGDILHTTNTLTPDASTALQYAGDQGVVDINGNLDVSTGDWILPGVVETTEVTTTSVSSEEQILGSTVRLNSGIPSLYLNFNVYNSGQLIQASLDAFKTRALAEAFVEKAKAAGSFTADNWVGGGSLRGTDNNNNNLWFGAVQAYTITINSDALYVINPSSYGFSLLITSVSSSELSAAYDATQANSGNIITVFTGEAKSLVLDVSTTGTSTVTPLTTGLEGSIRYNKDETELQLYTTTWNKVALASDIPAAADASPAGEFYNDSNISSLTSITIGQRYVLYVTSDHSSDPAIIVPDGTVAGQTFEIIKPYTGASGSAPNIRGTFNSVDGITSQTIGGAGGIYVWTGEEWRGSFYAI